MEYADAQLYALATHALNDAEAAEVRAQIAASPALAARIQQITKLVELLRAMPSLQASAGLERSLAAQVQRERMNGQGPEMGVLVDLAFNQLEPERATLVREQMQQEPWLRGLFEEILRLREQSAALELDTPQALKHALEAQLLAVQPDPILHPDDALLLDARLGGLTPSEQAALDQRLAAATELSQRAKSLDELIRLSRLPRLLSRGDLAATNAQAPQASKVIQADASAGVSLPSLPQIEVSAEFKQQLRERIAQEAELAESEQVEEDSEASKAAEPLESLRSLSSKLPQITPTDAFRERLRSALLREAEVEADARASAQSHPLKLQSKQASRAKPISERSRKASALLAANSPKRALILPKHRVRREVLKANRSSQARKMLRPSTMMAAAMHFLVLMAAYFFILETNPLQADRALALEKRETISVPLPTPRIERVDMLGAGDPSKDDAARVKRAGISGAYLPDEVSALSDRTGGGGMPLPHVGEGNVLPEDDPQAYQALLEKAGGMRASRTGLPAREAHALFQLRRTSRERKAQYLPTPNAIPLLERISMMQAWLVANQREDGSWRAAGTSWQDASMRAQEAALVALVLLGDGWLPRSGEDLLNAHGAGATERALDFLLTEQTRAGGFVSVNGVAQDTVQVDAICTLALAEAFAGTGEQRYKNAMRRAVKRLISKQITANQAEAPDDVGGFPYVSVQAQASAQADLVCGTWVMLALKTAEAAGLPAHQLQPTYDAFARHLRLSIGVEVDGTSSPTAGIATRSADSPQSQERATASAMSAARVAALLDASSKQLEMISKRQLEFLNSPKYAPSHERNSAIGERTYRTNFTAWFFGTLSVWQDGDGVKGEAEQQYLKALFNTYGAGGSSHFAEAKPGQIYVAALGQEEEQAGRVFSTAMACLCLENAYRLLPSE